MQQMTRRGALATMGVLATAGCSQLYGDASNQPSGDADRPSEASSPLRKRSVTEVSRTLTIEQGGFESVKLSFDQRTVLLFSVVADGPVDVLTFTRSNFRKYRDGTADQVSYVGTLSQEETVAVARGSAVSTGEPVLVVDNSTWGAAAPDGPVQVELEVEAFVRAAGDEQSSPSGTGEGNAAG